MNYYVNWRDRRSVTGNCGCGGRGVRDGDRTKHNTGHASVKFMSVVGFSYSGGLCENIRIILRGYPPYRY